MPTGTDRKALRATTEPCDATGTGDPFLVCLQIVRPSSRITNVVA